MNNGITLIWDIDDVLNRLTWEWLEHCWRPSNPECKTTYAELTSNPPHEILSIPLHTYLESLDSFRASTIGKSLSPAPETLAWFQQHGDRYRHIALTARPLASAPDAAEWVLRHYGRWIRGFGFVPSSRSGENLPDYGKTKAEWLQWISTGDALIDDSPTNLEGAHKIGIHTVLIPQPWNESTKSLSNVLLEIADL
jgi:FMN phosphatase YigB (HAD superfamily)